MALPNIESPAPYSFTIYQGSRWYRRFQLKDAAGDPYPLTGLTIAAKISTGFGRDRQVSATFTVTIIDEATGEFSLELDDDTTRALTIKSSSRTGNLGPWDGELSDGTNTVRFVEGQVAFSQEATI